MGLNNEMIYMLNNTLKMSVVDSVTARMLGRVSWFHTFKVRANSHTLPVKCLDTPCHVFFFVSFFF